MPWIHLLPLSLSPWKDPMRDNLLLLSPPSSPVVAVVVIDVVAVVVVHQAGRSWSAQRPFFLWMILTSHDPKGGISCEEYSPPRRFHHQQRRRCHSNRRAHLPPLQKLLLPSTPSLSSATTMTPASATWIASLDAFVLQRHRLLPLPRASSLLEAPPRGA